MRFGEVPEDLAQQLEGCDLAKLQALQKQVETSGDLASWLKIVDERS